MRAYFLVVFSVLLFSNDLLAKIFPYLNNYDLREQVDESGLGMGISGEEYVFASRPTFHFELAKPRNYYHAGVWVPSYLELSPNDTIDFNFSLHSGNRSYSYSYEGSSFVDTFWGVSLTPKICQSCDKFLVRLGDLGRQRVGTGLIVDEMDFSGGKLELEVGEFEVTLGKNGTHGFENPGDYDWLDISVYKGLLGLTISQSEVSFFGPYSEYRFENGFGYFLEGLYLEGFLAGNGGLDYLKSIGRTEVYIGGHYRIFENGFRPFSSITPYSTRNTTPEFMDKDFFNTANFVHLGFADITAFGGLFKLNYKFSDTFLGLIEAEYVKITYSGAISEVVELTFYTLGLEHFPFNQKDYSVGVYGSNKFISSPTIDPIENGALSEYQGYFKDVFNAYFLLHIYL